MVQAIRFDLIAGVDKWNRGFRDAERTSSRFGARLRVAVASGATAAAAGVGALAVGAFKLGESFDSAYDTIRVTTGKTGKSLGSLQKDFKAVVKDVPTDFESAATAIGKLNQRTGQTGKGLQRLAEQVLELSRITKTDLGENIAASTRLFRDWSIPTAKQAGTLDKMFRASQATGAGITTLMESVVQFGSPLRQLGFDLDTTTALFGEFERAGVVTETVLPGLKIALKTYALAHKDPQKALVETIKRIKESSTTAQANTIAFKTFGARAGPDLAAAIREGHFDLDLLIKTISNGKDTIRGAAADTADFAEKWKLFSNRMKVFVEPAVSALFGAVGKLADKLGKDVAPTIEAFITTHGPQFKTILDGVKRAFDTIYNALADPDKGVVPNLEKLRKSWEDNRQAIVDFQDAIPGANALLHAAGTAVHRLLEEVTGAGQILIGLGGMAARGALAVRVALDGLGVAALEIVGFFQDMALHGVESLQILAAATDKVFHTHIARSLQGMVDSAKKARADTQGQIDKLKADGTKRFNELRGNLEKPISSDNAARLRHDALGQIEQLKTGGIKRFRDLQRDGIDKIHGKTIEIKARTDVEISKSVRQYLAASNIPGFHAKGTLVPGYGGGDIYPAMLEPGEAVVPKEKASRPDFKAWAAAMGIPGFQMGGLVTRFRDPTVSQTRRIGISEGKVAAAVIRQLIMTPSYGGGAGAALAQQVAQWTATVLGRASEAGAWFRRLMFESGGNPRAVNRVDSNWLAGHPSVGIAQVIRGTFAANAGRFRSVGPFAYGVSMDPYANSYAGGHYAIGRYHSLAAVDPRTRPIGYDQGGYLPPGMSVAWNGTGRPEPVGVGATVVNIYPAPGMSERRVGQMVVEALEARDRRARKGGRP
ncbi:MAG TPA: phage tail tape measure protein [Pseudonocardiaceae bacterium]